MSIKVDNLIYHYIKKRPVIKGVSFDIPSGSSLCIMGAIDSGKSTLCQILCGLIKPKSGNIFVDGTDVTTLKPKHRNMAYLTEQLLLDSNKTAVENIAYGLNIRKQDNAEDKAIALLTLHNMQDIATTSVKDLSPLEQYKIALMRAVVRCPDLVILDDVCVNLKDTATITDYINATKEITANTTTIFATSSIEVGSLINQTTLALNEGEVIFFGQFADSQYNNQY